MSTIASRVREAVAASGRTQADVAASVDMTADAFSRALNGQRGFGALELAELERELGSDIHYLITGKEDPNRLMLSARHDFDHETKQRSADGSKSDESLLADVRLAYDQVGQIPASPNLPADPAEARSCLGEDFVLPFVERIEQAGVDIIRLEGLQRPWSFTLHGRHVIAMPPANGNWFYANWSLAHEMGHLCLGHQGVVPGKSTTDRAEADANAFAAELLLPKQDMVAIDWTALDRHQLASFLWERGVSTSATKQRLQSIGLQISDDVAEALKWTTQKLLRRHGNLKKNSFWSDPITDRMEKAISRHFPTWLVAAHLDGIAEGRIHKGTVAWMLEVDPDELEVEEPEPTKPLSSDDLMGLLG